jgi:outer membrane lipoprotein-sorting protein
MSARATPILIAALLSASCAAPLMKLPAAPGGAAVDARDAVDEATRACRAISTVTAEIAATGSVGGQRFRARLSAGLAAPASARLEAAAPFGAPMFILVANGNDATLLLPHDGRVLEHARPDAVLEALAGIPLDAAALRTALTGCASTPNATAARAVGDDWRVLADGPNEVYLHRDKPPAPWRLVATIFHPGRAGGDWRAEYREFQDGLPRSVRFAANTKGRFDLRLVLSQVDLNTQLGSDVFLVQVPRDADPITIDELRRARPGIREN